MYTRYCGRRPWRSATCNFCRLGGVCLKLSNRKAGETVTILTSSGVPTSRSTAARTAAIDLGAVLTVVDLPPTNGDIALSRDKVAFMGKTALQGNKAAMAALKQSDLVIDLMLLLFRRTGGDSFRRHPHAAGGGTSGSADASKAHH